MTDPTDDVRAAVEAALAKIATLPPGDAFKAAGALSDYLTTESGMPVAKLRAAVAAQLKAGDGLSLAGLAETLGISKARAAQLVRAAAETEDRHGIQTQQKSGAAVEDSRGHEGT